MHRPGTIHVTCIQGNAEPYTHRMHRSNHSFEPTPCCCRKVSHRATAVHNKRTNGARRLSERVPHHLIRGDRGASVRMRPVILHLRSPRFYGFARFVGRCGASQRSISCSLYTPLFLPPAFVAYSLAFLLSSYREEPLTTDGRGSSLPARPRHLPGRKGS